MWTVMAESHECTDCDFCDPDLCAGVKQLTQYDSKSAIRLAMRVNQVRVAPTPQDIQHLFVAAAAAKQHDAEMAKLAAEYSFATLSAQSEQWDCTAMTPKCRACVPFASCADAFHANMTFCAEAPRGCSPACTGYIHCNERASKAMAASMAAEIKNAAGAHGAAANTYTAAALMLSDQPDSWLTSPHTSPQDTASPQRPAIKEGLAHAVETSPWSRSPPPPPPPPSALNTPRIAPSPTPPLVTPHGAPPVTPHGAPPAAGASSNPAGSMAPSPSAHAHLVNSERLHDLLTRVEQRVEQTESMVKFETGGDWRIALVGALVLLCFVCTGYAAVRCCVVRLWRYGALPSADSGETDLVGDLPHRDDGRVPVTRLTRGCTGGAHVHLRREKRPSEGLAEDGSLLEDRVEEAAAGGQC